MSDLAGEGDFMEGMAGIDKSGFDLVESMGGGAVDEVGGSWGKAAIVKEVPKNGVSIRYSGEYLQILAEISEHLAAIFVDLGGRRGGTVLGKTATACF